jgi:apolipoprotein D and lipocalin family protein
MRLPVLLLAMLAGCATVTAPFLPAWRDRNVPIASKAELDLARFAGRWYETARFPVPFQRSCIGAIAEYYSLGPDRVSVRNLCIDAEGRATRSISGEAKVVGPGRLSITLSGVPVSAPLWVLWTDEDYRTAVLGQPYGRGGWILDRDPRSSSDRIAAAIEILRFNGYDTDALLFSPVTGPGPSARIGGAPR